MIMMAVGQTVCVSARTKGVESAPLHCPVSAKCPMEAAQLSKASCHCHQTTNSHQHEAPTSKKKKAPPSQDPTLKFGEFNPLHSLADDRPHHTIASREGCTLWVHMAQHDDPSGRRFRSCKALFPSIIIII